MSNSRKQIAPVGRGQWSARTSAAVCVVLAIANGAVVAQAGGPAGSASQPPVEPSKKPAATATATRTAASATPAEKDQPATAGSAADSASDTAPDPLPGTTPRTPPSKTSRRDRGPDVFVPSERVPEDRPLAFPVDI